MVIANSFSAVTSAALILLLPKLVSEYQFGLWQLYVFYTSFIGFFHLGLQDGMILRYAGQDYDALDRPLMKSQLLFLNMLQLVGLVALSLIVWLTVSEPGKTLVLIGFMAQMVIFLPYSHLQYLLQATCRFKEFSWSLLLEKAVFLVLVVLALLLGARDFALFLLADLCAKLVALAYACATCREVLLARTVPFPEMLREGFRNISVGLILLGANLAGILVVGVVRFCIEMEWGVVVFGQVGLAFNVCSFVLLLFSSVAQFLFPMLRHLESDRVSSIYVLLNIPLTLLLLSTLLLYQPLYAVMCWWLPNYAEPLRYLMFLLPLIVFQGKSSVLINTYLKVLRKERVMLAANIGGVIFAILVATFSVFVFHELMWAVISASVAAGALTVFAELLIARRAESVSQPALLAPVVVEIILTVAFIVTNIILDGLVAFIAYAALCLLAAWLFRGQVRAALATRHKIS
ncbi:MAG: hypothetical protein LBJ48_05935 [Coriobacteriales bacterium]|nr:hypothetical protein [Coriobacteriales bacterium]